MDTPVLADQQGLIYICSVQTWETDLLRDVNDWNRWQVSISMLLVQLNSNDDDI